MVSFGSDWFGIRAVLLDNFQLNAIGCTVKFGDNLRNLRIIALQAFQQAVFLFLL